MFDKPFEQRMSAWRNFRQQLETSDDPYKDVVEYYSRAPLVSMHTDPWDQSRWPDPWQLLDENQYCDFCTVLGWAFSLQLTERFKEACFEIHIITDSSLGYRYLLAVDDIIVGYNANAIHKKDLPADLQSHQVHTLPTLQ